jgi:hypothetical protein
MNGIEVFVPIAFFAMIYFVVKTVSDNRTRQKLIDKGIVDDKAKQLLEATREYQKLNALKWGMVLVALGMAMALATAFPYLFDSPAGVGLMFLFAGAAFILYHFVAKRQIRE